MATNKRRKLDTAEKPQAMSAFARLRQRSKAVTAQPIEAKTTAPDTIDNDATTGIAQESPKKVSRMRKSKEVAGLAVLDQSKLLNPNGTHATLANGSKPDRATHTQVDIATSLENSQVSTPDDQNMQTQPFAQLSTFVPKKSNFQKKSGGKVQLKLSGGERLVILGSYGITVTKGEITIHGAILRSEGKVQWVHAPHCHSLPVIRCSDETILELESHPAGESIRKLGRLSPHFRRLWNEEDTSATQRKGKFKITFQILFTSGDAPKRAIVNDLRSPPEWNREIDNLLAASRSKPMSIMITGPKSSGKSTFGKILANQLLTSGSKKSQPRGVAVLDLDPGQPEYCVAGQIALAFLTEPVLGPSFCRPVPSPGLQIIRSHALASITPASDPQLYCAAALDLMTHYRNQLGSCPLIINTPGWIQGTGLDLLTSLIRDLRPNEVAFMSVKGPSEVAEALEEAFSEPIRKLPSHTTLSSSRTAAELRVMQVISYFHSELSQKQQQLRWNSDPLTMTPPWMVRYSGPNAGIAGVMCYDYQVPPELLTSAINGTILAAVEIENPLALRGLKAVEAGDNGEAKNDKMDLDGSGETDLPVRVASTTPEGIPLFNNGRLDPKYSQFIGLVLVRGVEEGILQLLTPISPERIEQVDSRPESSVVLVSGKFDPASWAYTEDLYSNENANTDEGVIDQLIGDEKEAIDEPMTDADKGNTDFAVGHTLVPWIDIVHGNEKRVGSKVWRVRRDLGRNNMG